MSPMDFEPLVLERIKRYRRTTALGKAVVLVPLVSGVVLTVVLIILPFLTGRTTIGQVWNYTQRSGVAGLSIMACILFVPPALYFALRHPKSDAPVAGTHDKEAASRFSEALSGVSIGAGIAEPPLEVLNIPTVNSIALMEGGTPTVGVTMKALEADLSSQVREALMAHETAHIILGDYYLSPSSKRFKDLSLALFFTLVVLSAVFATVYERAWFILLILVSALPFALRLFFRKVRKVRRHNDLLADSVAAKMTSNPAGLLSAIEGLYSSYPKDEVPFPGGSSYPDFLFMSRGEAVPSPEETDKLKSTDGVALDEESKKKLDEVIGRRISRSNEVQSEAIRRRIDNMQAIERGNWPEFEDPDRHEERRNLLLLAASVVLVIAIVLAILLPWYGKRGVWMEITARPSARRDAAQLVRGAQGYITALDQQRELFNSAADDLLIKLREYAQLDELPAVNYFDYYSSPSITYAHVTSQLAGMAEPELEEVASMSGADEYSEYAGLELEILRLDSEIAGRTNSFLDEAGNVISSLPFDPAALNETIDAYAGDLSRMREEREELARQLPSIKL